MKVKQQTGFNNRRHRNASPKNVVVTLTNDLNSSCPMPVKITSLRYVSPLGNIVPKKNKEEKVTVEQKERRGSITRGVQKKSLASKSPKTLKRRRTRLKTKLIRAINNRSNEDINVILDVPAAQNDDSVIELPEHNSVVQKQNAVAAHLPPSTTPTMDSKSSNLDRVVPTEISGGIEVQTRVSTRQSMRQNKSTFEKHVSSGKSKFEFSHKKDKENLQQDVGKLNLISRPVISINDNNTNLVPEGHIHAAVNKDNEPSLNSRPIEKQSICEESSERNSLKSAVDSDLNSSKKVQNSSIAGSSTDNILAETVNMETADHVNKASSWNSKDIVREHETIDLEPDITDLTCATPNNTIVLSDEEDSTSDDIIVLGTPAVPSVESYKAISRKRGTGSARKSRHKRPLLNYVPSTENTTVSHLAATQDIIARAISQLSTTMGGCQMVGNASAKNPPYGQKQSRETASASTSAKNPPYGQKQSRETASASTSATPQSPNSVYGSNIYNPCGKTVKTGLRPVIIDGSNVAMGHGNGTFFSTKGLEICINYFVKRGHKVFAFVPQFRRFNSFTKDPQLLEKLHKEKLVIFTPSRIVDGQSDVPYDDRYIVQTAAELGGVIVSTDNFRDLLQENVQWHDTIKNRLLMFTWVEDLLIFPQDPLGRRGGGLDEFLHF